jgi:L-threonylcarbamoyladenylate synthase
VPPTRVVQVDASAPDLGVMRQAAQILRAGGLVAFPTETFYGLGAAGLDAAAARRVFAVKGRPSSMPLLLLVDSRAMVAAIAGDVPARAIELMQRHWPGALTLVGGHRHRRRSCARPRGGAGSRSRAR